jgi:hypothetical protein
MDKSKLIDYIRNKKFNMNFKFDELGFTWGVSHIRLVGGDKLEFDSLEHFYFSSLHSEKCMESGIGIEEAWVNRTDLKEWANGLQIKDHSKENFYHGIKEALIEIDQYKEDWNDQQNFDRNNIHIPDNLIQCFLIEEPVEPRHIINTTCSFIAEFEESYFLHETNEQS